MYQPTKSSVIRLLNPCHQGGLPNGAGGIPASGLKPKFAGQTPIGALPLWRHFAPVTPPAWGSFSPKPPRVRIPYQGSYTGAGGIRTPGAFRHNGFQDRRLKPLGHCSRLDNTSRETYLERSTGHGSRVTITFYNQNAVLQTNLEGADEADDGDQVFWPVPK